MAGQDTKRKIPPTKTEALAALRALKGKSDSEYAHIDADEILLELIDDVEIREAFEALEKWYA